MTVATPPGSSPASTSPRGEQHAALAPATGELLLVPALLLVAFVAKLPELVQPIATDQGLFAEYAALMRAGGQPYVAFWDVHPPLAYVYWLVVNVVSGGDWLRACSTLPGFLPLPCPGQVASWLDVALTLVCGLLTYAAARAAGGSARVGWVAALLVVYFTNLAMLSVGGSVPDKLTLAPSLLALWAWLRSQQPDRVAWPVVSGVAAVVAVLAKQPALLTLVALGSAAVWDTRLGQPAAKKRLVGFAVGVAAAVLVTVGWLAVVGPAALGGFVDQVWAYNLTRVVAGNWHAAAAGLTEPSVFRLDNVARDALALPLVGGLIGALVILARPTPSGQRLILWWAAVNLLAVIGFREFIQVVPGLALLTAIGVDAMWTATRANGLGLGRSWAGKLALLALFGTILALSSGFQFGQYRRAWYERRARNASSAVEQVAAVVAAGPPGPLFVWGNAGELYPLSGRTPDGRYLNAEALRLGAPDHDRARQELLADLTRTPPSVIVLTPDVEEPELQLAGFPELAQRVAACYAPVPLEPTVTAGRWQVFTRRPAACP
jgi:hypothetical protein